MAMKRMSFKTFLTKLRKLRGEFVVNSEGMLRTRKDPDYSRCPIEAVAESLGEPAEDNALPLQRKTRSRIINAADDNACTGRTAYFRRQMLKAVRAKEL